MEENQVHIPDGWKSYVGYEILKVQGGYAFKSNDYKDEGILLVRIGNVGNGTFVFKDIIYVPKRFQITHSNFQLWKGDVLMGLTGDLGKICILNDGDFPYFLNQRVGRFIPTEKIDNEYLFYLVSSSFVQSKFDAFFAGGAQKNISPKQIESINYILPKSKTEQTQIATILSKVDEAIAQTEQLIAKYTRIKTGLMQDLLTKGIDEQGNIRSEQTHEFKDSPLGSIPKEWEVDILNSFITYISYGFTNPMPEAPEGPFLITAANINQGRILYETARRTTGKAFKELLTKKSKPKINDILITKDGSIGRLAIVDSEYLCINQSVAVMRVREEKIMHNFLKMLLESNKYQDLIIADSGGSTIKHIYITKIDKMNIAIPSNILEQQRILRLINLEEKILNDTKNQLSKLQSLKTGLMQDLLSGKVRVNHLIKEKASV